MDYILNKYLVIVNTYDFSYTALESCLIAIALSTLLVLIPLRQPYLWNLIQHVAHFFYSKLNRANRTKKSRQVRGTIVSVFFLMTAFFATRFLFRFETNDEYWFALETGLLTLFLSSGYVWQRLFLASRQLAKKKSTENKLKNLIQEDLKKKDLFSEARYWITFAAKSFERLFVSPLFYFLVFGLYGLILSSTVSALKFSCSYKNEYSRNFAYLINFIDGIVNFIPSRLASFITLFAALLSKGSSFSSAVSLAHQAGKVRGINTGWILAVYAGALNVTLGGPALQEEKSTDQPWIGNSSASAKVEPRALNKALLLHFTSVLLVFLFMLAFLLFLQQ